ncbi:MAG: ACT domain-containing protein [Acidobacteriota bacterium]
MLILDKPQSFDGSTIKVPLYHRGHLSLFPGTKVWLCLLPGAQGEETLREIVISPIPFDSWSDLWRIVITMRDRVGLVNEVFRILADFDLNVVAAESSSIERQLMHSVEMIVDATRYSGDGTHEKRSSGEIEELPELRWAILANFAPEIAFLPSGRERLRIRRVQDLFEARRSFNETQQDRFRLRSKPAIGTSKVTKLGKKDVVIKMPAGIISPLLEALAVTSKSSSPEYLLVSDTTDRFLRAYFLAEGNKVIAPTVSHLDKVGAIAAITGAIREGGFNILTSLSRLYESESQAHTEFVLQPIGWRQGSDNKAIQATLVDAMSVPTLVNEYEVGISYPDDYSAPIVTKPLSVRRQPFTSALSERIDTRTARDRLRAYQAKLMRPRIQGNEHQYRIRLVEELLRESPSGHGEPRKLFISSSLKDGDPMLELIKRVGKTKGFLVIRATDLGTAHTLRSGVVSAMRPCTHFLGVWTEQGSVAVGEYFWPSPWLHFEFGVANTVGLHCEFLIDKRIHPHAWQRLKGEVPHIEFSTGDFEKRVKEALTVLKERDGNPNI